MEAKSIDTVYKILGQRILDFGDWTEGRNGRTISLVGTQLKYDLRNGFPLLNMRKIYHKGVVGEFISFLQDAKTLKQFEENGCPYWKLWAGKDGKLVLDYPPRDQLGYVIDLLKNDPFSRRILIDLWNPDNRGKLSLDPCHTQYQFIVREESSEKSLNKYKVLHMIWTQRSVDYAIGAPSDFILAALYLQTIANEVDMIAGSITFNFGDTHIYEEHVKDFKELLDSDFDIERINYTLTDSIYAFNKDSLQIHNYDPINKVKFELKA